MHVNALFYMRKKLPLNVRIDFQGPGFQFQTVACLPETFSNLYQTLHRNACNVSQSAKGTGKYLQRCPLPLFAYIDDTPGWRPAVVGQQIS